MTTPGDAALLALAATQHGVVSDEQAFALGYSDQSVRRRVRSGTWQRVLPGVIRCAGSPGSSRQLAMAACLWAGPDAIVSHRAAAALWNLDGVIAPRVEITMPRGAGRRSTLVSVHWSGAVASTDRTRTCGIPITSATRTLIDVAGALSMHALELAMEDAFRRRLAAPGTLARRLDQVGGRGRAGAANLRRLLDERGNRLTGSAAEVRLERLLVSHGLPRPVRQHPVPHRGRTIYVDLAYPDRRVAIEFDSLRWHTGRAKLDNDAHRRNLLGAAGWVLVTITYTMLQNDPTGTVATVARARDRPCAENDRNPNGFRA